MDPIDRFSFAVRCFFVWNSRCRKMINQYLGELRSARILVPTPANLIHIGARPFADHVLQLAELRQEWLFKFITHDAESIRMPPEERTIFEAASIVGAWKAIAPIWPFNDIDGPQLIGLVDLEACNCSFLRTETEISGARFHRAGHVISVPDILNTTVISAPVVRQNVGQPQASAPEHSEHYDSVKWYGTAYTFTAKQAAVVKVLWEAWLAGKPSVLGVELIEAAQSDGKRVRDIFKAGRKENPAWGTMIIKDGQSHFKLSPPKTSEPQ